MMWYFAYLCAALCLSSGTFAEVQECPEEILSFYEELNCQPLYKDSYHKCPYSFSCLRATNRARSDQCIARGHIYNIDEAIKPEDQEYFTSTCQFACRCFNSTQQEDKSPSASISCAIPRCIGPSNETCISQFKINDCCPYKIACPPFNLKCKLGSDTFYEGQRFFPQGSCKRCICDKNYKEDNLEVSNCKRIFCGLEVNDKDQLRRRCAPIYEEDSSCCPSGWVCPKDEVRHVPCGNREGKCIFGNKFIRIGESIPKEDIDAGEGNVDCKCRIPPFVTCTRYSDIDIRTTE